MQVFSKKTIFVIIGAVGLYVAFMIFSDVSLFVEKFQKFNFTILPLAISLVFGSYLIRGLRYWLLLKNLNIKTDVRYSITLFFIGLSMSITPGKLGETIKSLYLKNKHEQSITKTLPVVFVERYYDFVGVVILSSIIAVFTDFQRSTVIILFMIMICGFFLVRQYKLVNYIIDLIHKFSLLKKFTDSLRIMHASTHTLFSNKTLTQSSFLSVCAWILESVAIYLIFVGFDLDIDFTKSTIIFLVSSLVGAASMLPGGIGLTEGGMIGLLVLEKFEYTVAFSAVLLIRIITLWLGVILGLVSFKFIKLK